MNRKHHFLKNIAAFTLASSCFCPIHAQQPPSVPAVPQRIQITVVTLDVPPEIVDKLDHTTPDGDKKAGLILNALYKDQMTEAVILTLQTPNDFPAVVSYDKVVSFTSKKYPGRNSVDLITRLEATPHIEADGYVSMRLKTMFPKISPAGLPNQIGQGTTLPLFHLKNGVLAWFRGVSLNPLGQPEKIGDTHALEQVLFVSENVLPASNQAVTASGE